MPSASTPHPALPLLLCLLAALIVAPLSASSPQLDALELGALETSEGLRLAAASSPGDRLALAGVALGDGPDATLELRRLMVFSPDAELLLDRGGETVKLAVPDIAWYTGRVAGEPGSRAFLGVRPSGEVRGLISKAGGHWMLGRARGTSLETPIEVRRVDQLATLDAAGGYRCGSGELTAPGGVLPTSALDSGLAEALADKVLAHRAPGEGGTQPSYTARIAIETDTQFLDKFQDDADAALAYLGDLFAYVTGIFEDEVDTSLAIVHSQFWASSDPWNEANPACALLEFGRYWNDNNSGISRTIAHFFSGRSNGGGIAWVGVLCNGPFNFQASQLGCVLSPNTDNYGGAYGYTGDMDANFDLDEPTFVWDVFGWNHEVGHNFNSPHTHCYNGIAGVSAPVDTCESGECNQGCYCGAEALPCGSSGAGCGTIMSYCHLRSGGIGNISPTFGAGHPWGVQPDRVPDRMGSHVVARAASSPGCLDFFDLGEIFATGFESGTTGDWDAAFP